MRGKRLKLLGQKIGHLTVLKEGMGAGRLTTWICRCECGQQCEKKGNYLQRRDRRRKDFYPSCSQQCPVMQKHRTQKVSTRQGRSSHPVYRTYHNILQRCYNPRNGSWVRYGGRGIVVCKRWLESFENFWKDMANTHQVGLEIDRKNSDRNYTPSNCRWVTRSQNMQNRRNALNNTLGFPTNFHEIARLHGIKRKCLYNRIYKGMTWEQIISTPVRGKNSQ